MADGALSLNFLVDDQHWVMNIIDNMLELCGVYPSSSMWDVKT